MSQNAQTKPILELNNIKARKFFFRNESYCKLDMPIYLDFRYVLRQCSSYLKSGGYNYKSLCSEKKSPKNYGLVNYVIFTNKDGKFAWRKLEIIHPMLYVALVNFMTKRKNWKILKNRFRRFRSICTNIECCSLPIVPYGDNKQKAESIRAWSKEFVKKSVSLAIDFKYMAILDITDCYGSMYTHSISWATYGIEKIKQNIENNIKGSLPLEHIDKIIEDMSFGQTNGIPQGSILMDFIAELVLGYVDTRIQAKLQEKVREGIRGLEEIKILRFRDDYRIFSNDTKTLQEAMKLVSEVLSEFNFKLNTEKTFISSDIVIDSQKPDKLEWKAIERTIINSKLSLFNKLTQIKRFANRYPNSGSLRTALSELYKRQIYKLTTKPQDLEALVAIIVSIMMENPSIHAHGAAILSKLFSFLDRDKIEQYIDKIRKIFSTIPNSAYLDLWLQRASITVDPNHEYSSEICKIIQGKNEPLWNSDWLKDNKKPNSQLILNRKTLKGIPQVITPEEVDAFGKNDYSS